MHKTTATKSYNLTFLQQFFELLVAVEMIFVFKLEACDWGYLIVLCLEAFKQFYFSRVLFYSMGG